MTHPTISVVLVAYNIPRELPRTLTSLVTPYQRGVTADEIEVIVVDNGSEPPISPDLIERWGGQARLLRVDDAPRSPAATLNRGISEARAEVIGAMIDGARMVTPGLLHLASGAARLYPTTVVASLGWYLGSDMQRFGMRNDPDVDHWEDWAGQYERIRGRPYAVPEMPEPTWLGRMPPVLLRHLIRAAVHPVVGHPEPLGRGFTRARWAQERATTSDPVLVALLELIEIELSADRLPVAAVLARMARQYAPDAEEPQLLLRFLAGHSSTGQVPPAQSEARDLAVAEAQRVLLRRRSGG